MLTVWAASLSMLVGVGCDPTGELPVCGQGVTTIHRGGAPRISGFSPDGATMAYLANEDDDGIADLYLWTAATGQLVYLDRIFSRTFAYGNAYDVLSEWYLDHSAVFSPDGTAVTYLANYDIDRHTGDLYRYDLTTEEATLLAYGVHPAFTFLPGRSAFIYRTGGDPERLGLPLNLYQADYRTGEVTAIVSGGSLDEVSANGRRISYSVRDADGHSSLWVWDTQTHVATQVGAGHVMAFSRDGERFAFSGPNPAGLRVWEAATGTVTVVETERWVLMMDESSFSPDGGRLAYLTMAEAGSSGGGDLLGAGFPDGDLHVWDFATATSTIIDTQVLWDSLTFNNDGSQLAYSVAGGDLKIWNFERNRGASLGKGVMARDTAFSADGRFLAFVADRATWTGHLRVWDSVTEEVIPLGERVTESDVFYAGDGTQLLYLDYYEDVNASFAESLSGSPRPYLVELFAWDLNHPTDPPRTVAEDVLPESVAFGPGHESMVYLADCPPDATTCTIRLDDAAGGASVGQGVGSVDDQRFSPDGRRLVFLMAPTEAAPGYDLYWYDRQTDMFHGPIDDHVGYHPHLSSTHIAYVKDEQALCAVEMDDGAP